MRLTNAPNLKGTATNTPAATLPRGQPVVIITEQQGTPEINREPGHRLMIE